MSAVDPLTLRLPVALEAIGPLLDSLESFAAAAGLSSDRLHRLCLCLDEAVTNVITHGLAPVKGLSPPGARDGIRVRVWLGGEGTVFASVEDSGPAFNPLEPPAPDFLDAQVEDRPIGGLGIHLIRSMSDDLSYVRTAEGGNRLTLALRPRPVSDTPAPGDDAVPPGDA